MKTTTPIHPFNYPSILSPIVSVSQKWMKLGDKFEWSRSTLRVRLPFDRCSHSLSFFTNKPLQQFEKYGPLDLGIQLNLAFLSSNIYQSITWYIVITKRLNKCNSILDVLKSTSNHLNKCKFYSIRFQHFVNCISIAKLRRRLILSNIEI